VARLFLDANVFLHAIGADSPHRTACRAVLEAVGQGKLDGITSSEVLQEILHVRSRRMNVKDAASAVRAAADLVAEVLPVTVTTSSKPAACWRRTQDSAQGTHCTQR
jgi:predicted nucleic acid-binding protein